MRNFAVGTIILAACATGAPNLPEPGRTVASGELRLCAMPNGYLKQVLIDRSSWWFRGVVGFDGGESGLTSQFAGGGGGGVGRIIIHSFVTPVFDVAAVLSPMPTTGTIATN